MTTQEAYEKMREWLGRPGAEKCYVDDMNGWNCLYLRDDGNRCAIGCLLPDDLAQKLAETNESVSGLIAENAEVRELFKGVSEAFLSDAQQLHDYNDEENWVMILDETAERYNLIVKT